LEACPTGALHVDRRNGNVRTVDEKKCIGCEKCIEACPYVPGRIMWNHEDKHSQKCDLCADAPYLGEKGGPGGKQACVAVCPAGAIKFTSEIPTQIGNRGYEVDFYEKKANVRGWK
jgi:protein NrfC